MRGRPPQVSEEKLLDAARDVLLRRGAAATTAEIARRAGISEALVFYRYETKERLVAAVLDREMHPPARLAELVGAAGGGHLLELVIELGEVLLAYVRATLPLVEVLRSLPSAEATMRTLAGRGATPDRLTGPVAAYFEAEVRAGRLRPIDPRIVARALFGAILDRVHTQQLPGRRHATEEDAAFLRALADVLLHGAVRRTQRPARQSGR
jgi:AcrR family transcriptional regulator